MLRGISLQVKLALYQLCHVLISCLISESPSTVTKNLITQAPVTPHWPSESAHQPVLLPFGSKHPPNVSTRGHNWNTDSLPAGTFDRKKQAAWRTKNPVRNVLREGTVVEVVPTLKLIEAGAEVTIPTSMDFWQVFRLHEGPMPSLSYPIIESSKNSTAERGADSNVEHGSSWEKSVCKSVHNKLSLRSSKEAGVRVGSEPGSEPAESTASTSLMFSSSHRTMLSRIVWWTQQSNTVCSSITTESAIWDIEDVMRSWYPCKLYLFRRIVVSDRLPAWAWVTVPQPNLKTSVQEQRECHTRSQHFLCKSVWYLSLTYCQRSGPRARVCY